MKKTDGRRNWNFSLTYIKSDIFAERCHIPPMIYDVGERMPADRITTITSQIGYAPTLWGLLNWASPLFSSTLVFPLSCFTVLHSFLLSCKEPIVKIHIRLTMML